MPAFRPKNTRLGNVAEDIGLALLRGVTFVAPFPHPDDYGIDAIATLARDYDARRLIAESVFCVQLKKSSVTEISLTGDQINWLFNVPLPFYVGSVDVSTSTIKLYSDQSLLFAERVKSDWTEMNIVFDQRPTEKDIENGIVSLGSPIFSWQLSQLDSKDFRAGFYDVLKAHVHNSGINRVVRPVGMIFLSKWDPGCLPESTGWYSARPARATFPDIDDYVAPMMDAWSDQAVKDNAVDSLDDWIAIFIKKRLSRMAADGEQAAIQEYLNMPVNRLKHVITPEYTQR